MVHTFTKRKQRMYRYYTCSRAVNSGHDQCPQPTIAASTVEQEVLKHVRQLATDLRHSEAEILRLTNQGVTSLNLNTLADLQRRSSDLQQRIAELDQQIQKRSSEHITQQEVDAALADFEGLWDAWTPREQTSLVRLVVSQVEIDSLHGNVSILLHDTAIRNLMTRTKGAKHAQN
jgi:TolA-binding protein